VSSFFNQRWKFIVTPEATLVGKDSLVTLGLRGVSTVACSSGEGMAGRCDSAIFIAMYRNQMVGSQCSPFVEVIPLVEERAPARLPLVE
jgi:hypothetical protein